MLLSLEGGIKGLNKLTGGLKMTQGNFRKWALSMFKKYGTSVTFEELHRRGEI